MNSLIKDIKTATNMFLDMRQARKDGCEITLEKKRVLPFMRTGGFYGTVEGCTLDHLDREIVLKAQEAFNAFPDEVKYQLQFSPKAGEYKSRTALWRAALKPVMTDKQYHAAMNCIISWYIHIVKMRKARVNA